MVALSGVEPEHPFEYQILSLARLPIPPQSQREKRRRNQNSKIRRMPGAIATFPFGSHGAVCFRIRISFGPKAIEGSLE